jgi:hypothetical protein
MSKDLPTQLLNCVIFSLPFSYCAQEQPMIMC